VNGTAPMTGTAPEGSPDFVGVIGGLGPEATAVFLTLVARLTAAECDQDHVDMVVLDHASIPDRTAFILGLSAEDPGPVIAADAVRLARFGVSFLVIPCNTAHHFADQVTAAVDVPLLSIVDETVAECARRAAGPEAATSGPVTVGVLATAGTIRARIYEHALAAAGMECVIPDDEHQNLVTRIVYDAVKAGRPVDAEAFDRVVEHVRDNGAQVVALCCTELSVAATSLGLSTSDGFLVSSLDVLARRTIERAGKRVR
jgi:aspartate racemase